MDDKTLKSSLWSKAQEIRASAVHTKDNELAGLLEQAALRIENLSYFKQEVMERVGNKY